MKPYGVKKKDTGCCPGHDKYPKKPYKIRRTKGNNTADRKRKAKERIKNKREYELVEKEYNLRGDINESRIETT